MIPSVFYSQKDLIRAVRALHCPNGFDLDPTYGRGNIHAGFEDPECCFDLNPQFDHVRKIDCRFLPFKPESINSIIFDPPFLAGGGESGRMNSAYGSYKTWRHLFDFYYESLREFYIRLDKNGILVFKCQDLMNGRTQYWSHCEIYKMALANGFYALDLFILVSGKTMRPYNMSQQIHARKKHCYFWVFKKCRRSNGDFSAGIIS